MYFWWHCPDAAHFCSWHCSSGCVFSLANGHGHQWHLCLSLIISWEARPPHFTASGFLALPLNTYLSSPAVCHALPNSSSSCCTPDVQTETSPDSALRNCTLLLLLYKKRGTVALQHCGMIPCCMWKIEHTVQEETFHFWHHQTCSEHCWDLVHAGFAKQFSVHLHLSSTHWWDLGHYICAYFTESLLSREKKSQFISVRDWLMRITT